MFNIFKQAKKFSSLQSLSKSLTPKSKSTRNATLLLTSGVLTASLLYNYEVFYTAQTAVPSISIPTTLKKGHGIETIKEKYGTVKPDDPTYEEETIQVLKDKLTVLEEDPSAKSQDIAAILVLLYNHCMSLAHRKREGLAFREQANDRLIEIEKGKIEHLETYDDLALMAKRYDLDEAIRLHLKSIEKKQAQLGKNTPTVVVNYSNLSEIYLNKGDVVKANEFLKKSKFTMEYFDNNSKRCDDLYKECQSFHYLKEYYYSNEYCEKSLECFHRFDKPNELHRKARAAETIIDNSVALGEYEKALYHTDLKNEFLSGKDESYYKTKGKVYIEMSKKSQERKDIAQTVVYQTNAANAYENVPGDSEKYQLYIIYRNLAKNHKSLGQKTKAKLNLEKARSKSIFPDTDESIQYELRELEGSNTGLVLGTLGAVAGAVYFLVKDKI